MAFITLFMDLNIKPPSLQIWKRVGELVKNSEVLILLVFVTFIGSTWGFIETFIVWYLEELGASRSLIGFSFTIAALSGIPLTIFAGAIERRIGHIPILIIGIFAYAVRLIGYSYSQNAYHVLFFEILEGISTSLVVVTITTYARVLSSTELLATMQATWSTLHYAAGRALGSAIGGVMMDNLGSKNTYQLYAMVCIIAGCLYTIIYWFWLRKKPNKRHEKRSVVEVRESSTESSPVYGSLSASTYRKTKYLGTDNPGFVKIS